MPRTALGLLLLLPLAFVAAAPTSVFAQTTRGSISGTVIDVTKGVLPGVTVTVIHVATAESRIVVTDTAGRYAATQLALGVYEVRAELAGFKTAVRQGIALTIGREAVLDITLETGDIEETVTVTGDAPLVETRTSALGGLVDDRTLRDIPLSGRSFDSLITLNPGAIAYSNRERLIGAGMGNYFSVSGLQPQMNRFLLDGTEYNGASFVSTTPGGVSGMTLGLEAVAEFTVLRNTYSAEYGKRGGAQVSVATKSGTNGFHGSVLEFYRDEGMNSPSYFARGGKPDFMRNSFGGVLGGPILRNRTFFFGGYEGFREREALTLIGVVPNENTRKGLLPDRENPGQLRDVGLNPAVVPFLNALFPPATPGGRDFGDGTAELLSEENRNINEDFATLKIDHNLSDSDSLFVRYQTNWGDLVQPDTLTGNPWSGVTHKSTARILTSEHKHIFSPSVLNVFRFGYNGASVLTDEKLLIDVPPEVTFIPGRGMGMLRVGATSARAQGTISLGGSGGVQHDTAFERDQFAFANQLSAIRGSHSLKVGTEIQRIHVDRPIGGSTRGSMSFEGLEDLLLGRPRTFSAVVGEGPGNRWRQTLYGFYVQDDFSPFSRLTLNLGLRYEFLTVPKDERDGGQAVNFRLVDTPRGLVPSPEPIIGPSPFVENKSLKGFAPRIGVAWDPAGDGRTAVRGGFGVFGDQLDNLAFKFGTRREPPYSHSANFELFPPFPYPFEGGRVAGRLISPGGMPPDAEVPTILQYNVTFQREVLPETTLLVAYVASNGYNLTRNVTVNTPFPEIRPDGQKFFPAGAPRRVATMSTGGYWFDDGFSSYDSLQLELSRRLRNAVRLKAAYTLSTNRDTNTAKISEEIQAGSALTMDPDAPARNELGPAVWDATHNFVFNYSWDLPFGQGRALMGDAMGFVNGLVSGWQLVGVTTMTSGNPFTLLVGFDSSRNQVTGPDRPNLVPGASGNPILGSPDQWYDPLAFSLPEFGTFGNLGRNSGRLDGLVTFDFSIFKNMTVTENSLLQLRFEFFNLFNHTNFGVPDLLLFNRDGSRRGAAGQIRTTSTSPRQVQLGVKYIF